MSQRCVYSRTQNGLEYEVKLFNALSFTIRDLAIIKFKMSMWTMFVQCWWVVYFKTVKLSFAFKSLHNNLFLHYIVYLGFDNKSEIWIIKT